MFERPAGKIVWVTNDSGRHDFSSATKFGTLVPLTVGKVNVFSMDKVWSEIRAKLDPVRRDDYLLVAGHAVLAGVAINEVLSRFDVVRLLLFGANDGQYKVITLNRRQFANPLVGKLVALLAEIRDTMNWSGHRDLEDRLHDLLAETALDTYQAPSPAGR